MSDKDLEGKVAASTAGLLQDARRDAIIEAAWKVESLPDAAELARRIQP